MFEKIFIFAKKTCLISHIIALRILEHTKDERMKVMRRGECGELQKIVIPIFFEYCVLVGTIFGTEEKKLERK